MDPISERLIDDGLVFAGIRRALMLLMIVSDDARDMVVDHTDHGLFADEFSLAVLERML
jgi:hypothetical protein